MRHTPMRRRMASLSFALLVTLSAPMAWSSNTPVAGSFHGCAPGGNPAQTTNALKNRASQVAAPTQSTIAELSALPTTGPMVATLRSQGVFVEGFLVAAKQEGKESCNCGDATLHDFHVWLADQSGQTKQAAAVVEVTPRWRAANPGWKLATLQHLISQKAKVRLTGWRYLDPNHQNQVGLTRASRWEIHPITKFEVFNAGSWTEL